MRFNRSGMGMTWIRLYTKGDNDYFENVINDAQFNEYRMAA